MTTFSSNDVSAITGATLRQIQFWDEQGIIPVTHTERGFRVFDIGDILLYSIAKDLRKRGMPLQSVRRVIKPIRDMVRGLDLQGDLYFITDGVLTQSARGRDRIVLLASESNRPVLLVDAGEILRDIRNYARKNRPLSAAAVA